MNRSSKHNSIENYARERQANVKPVDFVRNVAKFDAALWTGKGIHSKIQLLGTLILGLFFFANGTFFLAAALGILDSSSSHWDLAKFYTILLTLAIAAFGIIVGWRLFYNWMTRVTTLNTQRHKHNLHRKHTRNRSSTVNARTALVIKTDTVKWQAILFACHLGAVYFIANTCSPWLAGCVRSRVLPFFNQTASSSSFEFLFSHLLVFSFGTAFFVSCAINAGLIKTHSSYKAAQFVWLIPTIVLMYKFITFRSAVSVLQAQNSAFHQYFSGSFHIPEFRDWHDFWVINTSNLDMQRGMAQLKFTAPFYAGVAYSVAAWVSQKFSSTPPDDPCK